MNFRILLFFLVISLSFTNCKDEHTGHYPLTDDCPERVELGEFDLSAQSNSYFPYQDTDQRLIFTDNSGNEVVGTITEFSSHFRSMVVDYEECNANPDISKFYSYSYALNTLEVEFPAINQRLSIYFTVEVYDIPEYKHYDRFSSSLYGLDDDKLNHVILIPTDDKTAEGEIESEYDRFTESITLQGKEFKDVYVGNMNSGDGYIMYVCQSSGIIAIQQDDALLVFDRIE